MSALFCFIFPVWVLSVSCYLYEGQYYLLSVCLCSNYFTHFDSVLYCLVPFPWLWLFIRYICFVYSIFSQYFLQSSFLKIKSNGVEVATHALTRLSHLWAQWRLFYPTKSNLIYLRYRSGRKYWEELVPSSGRTEAPTHHAEWTRATLMTGLNKSLPMKSS